MTRLIKLIMVATLVVVSAAHAQLFDEDYTGSEEPSQAYVTTNGVEWVEDTGLTISNSAAVFMYTNSATFGGDGNTVTNALVEFTVKPVLNDAVPTDVDGASVVFWVGTDSNVYRLVSSTTPGVTESNVFNVMATPNYTADTVEFSVTNNYHTHEFSLVANGELIFNNVDFYDLSVDELTQLEVRETSDSDVAVVKLFEVQELDANGDPTAVTGADLTVYEKDGKVYVEVDVETDGKETYFVLTRYAEGDTGKTNPLWTSIVTKYIDGQSVYAFEDGDIGIGEKYIYTIQGVNADGSPDGLSKELEAEITVVAMLEAKSFEMTQTQMTLTFASVSGETYKVVGLTALKDGVENDVAEVQAEGDTTSVTVDIGENFYFKIIKVDVE